MAEDMGVVAYIMKPIEMKCLAKILRNVLDKKKSSQKTL
jgi:response regulator of citrate/malate metabolism